jgi:hypothetical protein
LDKEVLVFDLRYGRYPISGNSFHHLFLNINVDREDFVLPKEAVELRGS